MARLNMRQSATRNPRGLPERSASLSRKGNDALVVRLGSELSNDIALEAPVKQIFSDSNKVTVKSDKGGWQASHVVVAVSLPLSVRIVYDPALPPHRDIRSTCPWAP